MRSWKDSGPLWQGRFFDRALRTVKEYYETLEYIHCNPVKAGLVARPEDWRWSSVHGYPVAAFDGLGPVADNQILAIDRVDLPLDPRARI